MGKSNRKNTVRRGDNSFLKTVLNVFIENPFRGYNFRQLSHALGISDKASKQLVKDILIKLESQKSIIALNRGKYKLSPSYSGSSVTKSLITGVVDMKQTGKAYILTDELGEDIFISANNTNRALHRDTVKVRLFPKRKGRKVEGQIDEVIKRHRDTFVGIVELSGKYAFLVPDDTRVPIDIYLPAAGLNNAKHGEKAIARITDWPENAKNPFGEIVEVLGQPGEHNVEMQSILAGSGFPIKFPKYVREEAKKIVQKYQSPDLSDRMDFRNIFTCTIDPEDAKDFDDALSLHKLDNGNWEVGIHIADVSFYIKPGGAIDEEAYKRATSVYLVDRVIPMLPEELSNDLCSLNPHVDKLCYAAVFELDHAARVVSEWFGRTIINSDRRYNYEEVQKIIEGGTDKFGEEMLVLHDLSSRLRKIRFEKGAIAFTSQEVKFKLDDEGKPIEAFIKEQNDSNRLVEDFMLLANRKVAERIGRKHGKQEPRTFVYRIHDQPNPEKLNTFAEFLKKLGYKVQTGSQKTISNSLNKLFEEIKGKGEENMIESIAVRTMAKAEYSIENIGHYGLAFKYYTHFTSPIRRYPDLMVHRLLHAYLNGQGSVDPTSVSEQCKHSSEMERKALEAERASIKYKQAEFMLDKIGQVFTGLISGVSKWGIYVELEGNKVEGMISLKMLEDDFYYLDEDNYKVQGAQFGKEYKLGDPITIKVRRIDLARKQLDFELA